MNSIEDIRALLADPWLRITSGRLYKIKVKAQAVAPLASLASMSDDEFVSDEEGGGGSEKYDDSGEAGIFYPPTPKNFQNFKNLDEQGASVIALPPTYGITDDEQVLPFVPNEAQLKLLRHLWTRNVILKARQLGFCVDPDTRVLTADLRWVRIADLTVGQEVVAVDEQTPGGRGSSRRMRTATVQAVAVVHRKAYRIYMDDGRTLVCTDKHPWLTSKTATDCKWRSISGQGNLVTGKIKPGTWIRWVTKPWAEGDYEDGWFGGMLDGEGSMAKTNSSAGVNVSQRPGPVWDRLTAYAQAQGYHPTIEQDQAERPGKHGVTPVPKLCFGRMDEMFRLIGQCRPTRFLAAGRRFWENRELPGKKSGIGWSQVIAIEPLDERPMIDMQTSTGTYIAEGFVSHNTTLVSIMWLDHALFNGRQKCGVIAHTKEAAEEIFKDKILLAYNQLPETLRERMPLAQQSSTSVEFAHNGSRIVVTNSARSGTFDRLHISEFGKISARDPGKAREVITGSLPAVPADGIVIVESTAEGQSGEFFDMVQKAMAHMHAEKKLNKKEFRLHFYSWWSNEDYRLVDPTIRISRDDEEYFQSIEALVRETGYELTLTHDQKVWWVSTRDNEFGGQDELMWQEYPSYPAEAFKVSLEGVYYAKQLSVARKQKRIGLYPHIPGTPVDTFWDIGNSDGTGIWLMQRLGGERRFIGYEEGWEEGYDHYTKALQETGYLWGTHHLPHDADHKRQTQRGLTSPKEELEKTRLGGKWVIVARVDDLQHGIQMTRTALAACTFDEAGCKKGLNHLWNYRKMWNRKAGAWSGQPDKAAGHSEAADALRQFAQAGGGAPSQSGPSRDSIRKHVNRKRNR